MKHLAFWTQRSSTDESLKFIKELALSHAQKGGHAGSRISDLITNGDYRALCEYDLDYSVLTVHEARNCRQALAFYKKCTYLPLKENRKERAKAKFVKAELKCRETNEIFNLRDQGLFNLEPWADAALQRAKAKISRVLGTLPRISELDFKFGPGATTLTKKRQASVAEKLTAGFSCSEDLLPYASRILEEIPEWFKLHESTNYTKVTPVKDANGRSIGTLYDEFGRAPVVVLPGRVNFVPKDAMTDRSIIVEGSLNVLIQGAIGRYMFRRLKASGIDLSDQSRNQRLAKIGSLTGALATLDLVSASDMMAIAIVRELLPWEWYFFLSTCRSSTVMLDGEPMLQEKFSSMGNGFTFPLQSLIFWALSSSVDEGRETCVYGDDIIVSSSSAPRVARLLEICGFEVNRKKSFWTGPFRESCGADYLRGIDIRPWYHREMISPADLFRLHNYYVRHDDQEMADVILSHINPSLRIFGPDGYGDGHLVGDWIPRKHKRAHSHGYGGVLFDTFKLKPVRDKRFGRKGDKVLPVYTIYVRENSESVLPGIDAVSEEYRTQLEHSSKFASFLRIRRLYQSKLAVEALPESRDRRSGVVIKNPSLPGTQGYVKVSIYTFNASES